MATIKSIEEKAKAYDEAKSIMEKYLKSGNAGVIAENTIKKAFPELAESEDERIRKAIIKHFEKERKESRIVNYYGVDVFDILAWLERQGEQKPTQEIEPFETEHGKYYYCIKDYFCGGKKQASKGNVVQALRGLPIMGLKDASEYFLPVNFIKCNSAWSEENEKIYQSIMDDTVQENQLNDKQTNWLEDIKYRYLPQPKQEWSKLDNRIEDCIGMCLTDISEKRFDDFKTSLKECLDWLHSLKDRIWYQPAQEWSEEDKRLLGNILFDLETLRKSAGIEKDASLYQDEINWLKSLRPQNHWKPSDEQIQAVKEAACYSSVFSEKTIDSLISLSEQLKKLKEE